MLEGEVTVDTQTPFVDDNVTGEKQETGDSLFEPDDIEPIHPIAAAIDKFILRVLDVRFSGETFIPAAVKWQLDQLKKYEKILEKNLVYLESEDELEKVVAIKNVLNASDHLERLEKSELASTLAIGHFLSLFSAFDAFTGDLLSAVYSKKPELFKRIERSLTVSELLQYEKIDDIKNIILQNEIESFRRKSYVEQFELLERLFGVTLKRFGHWPYFVECSQRRNLLTHCDGIISEQYLKVCEGEGCKFGISPQIGEKLGIAPDYFEKSCNVMIEVSLKLGQTLWRKLFEFELQSADNHLQTIQYDFLKREDWTCACMAGEFATNLPKFSEESLRLIMIVNLAIAQAFSGQTEAAHKTLDKENWSTLCYDFKLAYAVIKNQYEEAGLLMERIGKEGEYVFQNSYHLWPLFKHFRESKYFLESYNRIYGIPFVTELKRVADEAKEESEAEIKKIKDSFKNEPKIECKEVDNDLANK